MQASFIVYAVIIITALISFKGFKDLYFRERMLFHVDQVLRWNQWERMFTSSLVHADEVHLVFNMIALYFFGDNVCNVQGVGALGFILIYIAALLGGGLLALLLHRNESHYRALGASGAVSGIMLFAIMVNPFEPLGFFFLPFSFPAWVMGLFYIGVSIYGAKKKMGNIGHSAHLGGAIIGLLAVAVLQPQLINLNPILYFAMLVPSLIFLLLEAGTVKLLSLGGNPFQKKTLKERHHRYDDYNPKIDSESQLNQLLDKVSKKGINALTEIEKKRLDELSKK